MTLPAFLFGSIISILIGSIFHLIVGGNLRKYLTLLISAWFGFWIGYYLSNQISFSILRVGVFDLGYCILGSILISLFIYWIDKGSDEDQENTEDK